MKNNEREQTTQKEEAQEDKQESISAGKEVIFQRLRDMGIKVIDATQEWEGKTAIITTRRTEQNPAEEQPCSEN